MQTGTWGQGPAPVPGDLETGPSVDREGTAGEPAAPGKHGASTYRCLFKGISLTVTVTRPWSRLINFILPLWPVETRPRVALNSRARQQHRSYICIWAAPLTPQPAEALLWPRGCCQGRGLGSGHGCVPGAQNCAQPGANSLLQAGPGSAGVRRTDGRTPATSKPAGAPQPGPRVRSRSH